jgi:large subunit ribosomal protein L4
MELTVQKISGETTEKKIKLDKNIFAVEPNDHAIYLEVKRYLAAQRQGTHKTKQRSEVSYSTKKIKKQKGTGTARAGSRRSPIFKGGGRTFGPQPRSYEIKVNKKVRLLAKNSALTYKAKGKSILVVEDFQLDLPKTKTFLQINNKLNVADKKILFVLHEKNNNIELSARNLQKVKVVMLNNLTTYDIMNSNMLLFSESSLNKLQSKN